MPGRRQTVNHRFTGGWATDFGAYADVSVSASGAVEIPFLVEANNVEYLLDGSLRKIGGLTKYNSSALASGADVTGIYDFWRYAGSASATQTIVAHAGELLVNATSGATISSGHTAGAVPDYTTFDDVLIYSTNSDAPRYWDGTSDAALSGAPNFSFSEVHKNRLWGAGVAAQGSTLYGSIAEDPTDFTGSGSVEIKVSPEDGDVITAIRSYRGELWIFKGPHRGSIWRLQGSAPESSDPFRLVPFAQGLGAVNNNVVFRLGNDLAFMHADGSVHSLTDTAAVAGQYQMSALSLPINSWLQSQVVASRLPFAQAAVDTQRGYGVFTLTRSSGSDNNIMLLMDYRFSPVRWSLLTGFSSAVSLAAINDPSRNNRPAIVVGGTDGFVRRFNQSSRAIDGTQAYTYRWKTPTLHYGDPFALKQASELCVSLVPKGSYPLSFGWKQDGRAPSYVDFEQMGGDVLAPASNGNPFVLNQSRLGAGGGADIIKDLTEFGEFRSIQYFATNGELNQSAEVHGFSVRMSGLGTTGVT